MRSTSSGKISIHAPLAGCDNVRADDRQEHLDFNPRTPCGVRPRVRDHRRVVLRFQSTHPLRGATPYPLCAAGPSCISIHAPLAGCDKSGIDVVIMGTHFNPRTPCGVRLFADVAAARAYAFQSTHPLRGATPFPGDGCKYKAISIHAPLAGCDRQGMRQRAERNDFNPRTPCGVRLYRSLCVFNKTGFQSTHPLRGATLDDRHASRRREHFNPRTPCGVRPAPTRARARLSRFQSTHPLRGATVGGLRLQRRSRFQSTHPLRGATIFFAPPSFPIVISIHAPLAGCDQYDLQDSIIVVISIHAPLAGCDLSGLSKMWIT